MKENVLDVLRYLFEQYMDEDSEVHPDRESLHNDLVEVGFSQHQVGKALEWLEGLADRQEGGELQLSHSPRSLRVFTEDETSRLDVECRGFILYLEQVGILDGASRELIIDRVMALEGAEIDIEELKWVVLMVLFNQPETDDAYERMEDLMIDGFPSFIH
ncbi:MAG: DUF494 family protein [Gammaproteobacteria bacterium]